MSATLEFLNTDNVTVITTLDVGNVASPGTSTQTKLFLKNVGDQSATATTIAIQAIGTNDGSAFALMAPDSGGSPGTFASADLAVGTLAASAEYAFWVMISTVAGLSPDGNPRRVNLHASGQTI
jgi:hypothetical protein